MSHRQRDTHELHVYSLADSGGYAHTQSLRVSAHAPPTASARGTRQTMGGFAVDADMVAYTSAPAADAIEENQSVVLERLGDDDRVAYLIDGKRTHAGRFSTAAQFEFALAREEGADLSMFPEP